MNRFKGNKKAFGMVELLITVIIIGIGISSIMSLMASIISADKQSLVRIVSINLARESTEIVKNIRDTNWLKGNQWDEGLYNFSDYTAIANYDFIENEWYLDFEPNTFDDQKTRLYIDDETNIYSHSEDGIPTEYSRLIELNTICHNDASGEEIIKSNGESCVFGETKSGIEVVTTVRWESGNYRYRDLSIINKLYNWR